jgi:hypothetical protein
MQFGMRRCVLFLFLMMAGGRSASAQAVSIGVKGGIPLTDGTVGQDESRSYLVGPTIEVRLPAGFAIEADALYQRIGNTSFFGYSLLTGSNLITGQPPLFPSSSINQQRGNSWEFPILGKYYFRPVRSGIQPFAGMGYAFRTIEFHNEYTQTTVDANGASQTFSGNNDFRSGLGVGAVFAAGVRIRAGRFSLLPEFRYTRWGQQDFQIRKNEAGILLGISF